MGLQVNKIKPINAPKIAKLIPTFPKFLFRNKNDLQDTH